MSDLIFQVGDVVVNEVRQFAKIISIRNGVYGFSGWTTLPNAQKATVAQKFLNSYGAQSANLQVVKGASKVTAPADEFGSNDKKPTKSSLVKLNAEAVKALAEKLGVNTEGTKPAILERLYTHYEI